MSERLNVTVYGVRGSYPVCRRAVMRYGGNTTCLRLRLGSDTIVIDGGTGIAPLGRELLDEGPAGALSLFLTHPHWDHVMGLPFFQPLYDPRFQLNVFGADSETKTLAGLLASQHRDPSFPVPFQALGAELRIQQLSPGR